MADQLPQQPNQTPPAPPSGQQAVVSPVSTSGPSPEVLSQIQGLMDFAPLDDLPEEPLAETPAAAQPAVPQQQVPPPPPKVTQAQIQRALDVGITPEEAQTYSPEQLDRTIGVLERGLAKVLLAQRGGDQPKPPEPEQPQAPVAEEEFKLGLDPNQYDQNVISAFNGIVNHFQKKLKAIEEKFGVVEPLVPQVQSMVQAQQEQQIQQYFNEFDAGIAALGEDYQDLFGKDRAERQANPALMENAKKVYEHVRILHAGYTQNKMQPPGTRELVALANQMLHANHAAEKAKAKATAKVQEQLRGQNGQFIQRPSEVRQPGSASDAHASTLATIADIMRRDRNGTY